MDFGRVDQNPVTVKDNVRDPGVAVERQSAVKEVSF